jgi:hypothetical protein
MSQFSASNSPPATPVAVPPMSKLIRSKATKQFLTIKGLWTDKLQNAARFADRPLALAAVQTFCLHNVELYYLFDEQATSRYDFTISLS